MRRFFITVALIAGPAVAGFCQFQFGPQIGLDFNNSDLYVGANAVFNLPWELNEHGLQGNPEVNFYFLDSVPGYTENYTLIALNALYPLDLEFVNAYLGGGLLIGLDNVKDRNGPNPRNFHNTDIGLNTKFGVDFAKEDSKIIPWGEIGLHIKDGSGLWLQGGARFVL